jgi:formate hydrogenlyase subunit 6/NADH:ubiquinone oxidoreductase subunit I
MKPLGKRYTLLEAVLEAISKPPETVKYPFAPHALCEAYRGEVTFDPENCSGCGLCVRDCPADALDLEKESRDAFMLIYYPARCAYCGQCEESCRQGAISLSNKLVKPTTSGKEAVLILKDCRE